MKLDYNDTLLVDHLTSAFSPYNYCFYFLCDYLGTLIWPTITEEERNDRIILSPMEQAFNYRASQGNNSNSNLRFPFLSLYPESMNNDEPHFAWNSFRNLIRNINVTENYNVSVENANIEFQAVLFVKSIQVTKTGRSTGGFDEIMRIATILETTRRFNKTHTWAIKESIDFQGETIPVEVNVPIRPTLGTLELNPVWKESDWLTQNKIITLNCTLTMQTLKPVIRLHKYYKIDKIVVDLIVKNNKGEELIEVVTDGS